MSAPAGVAAGALVLLAAVAAPAGPARAAPAVPDAAGAPPRPAGCRTLPPGGALQEALDALGPGAALCLAPGRHAGPARIPAGATLWGPRAAVVASPGSGTTVALEADGATLLGVTVSGSGRRFDKLDAGVRIGADDARVEGVRVEGALFGILVEQSNRARVVGNDVAGEPDRPLGLRGDGIRLWEVRDSRIEGNHLADGRDLVVWYSPGNRFAGNTVERGRYGTHFMYSHGNAVLGNRYVRNVVGVFAMYSRNLEIAGNVFAESGGAAGVGLGCKESGNLHVAGNAFVGNTVGVYLDTCPLYLDESNRIEDNLFQFSDAALVLHGSERRNLLRGNVLRANRAPLRIEGRSEGEGVRWVGNHFDDYAGYDLDGDGVGDVAYELRSLQSDMVRRFPQLAALRGTFAMGVIEALGRMIPLYTPRLLLVDPEPRMAGAWDGPHAG